MRREAFIAAGLLAMMTTACGGSEEPQVVEQIVVREPGQAAPAVEEIAGEDEAGDLVAAGKAAFAMCTGCHVAEAGAPSRAGPNLHGVFGRKAGALDDFAYSDALAGSGLTWDAATLDRYLANPTGTVPGTIMASGAVEDAERRAAIIAYLETLGG